jgi:hypothetical protein
MRIIGVGPRAVWENLWPSLVAAGGMAAVLVPIEQAIDPAWPTLIVGALAGGLTYLGLLWLLARDSLRRLFETALGRGRRSEPEPPEPDLPPTELHESDVLA